MDSVKISIPNKPEYVSVIRLTTSAIASRMGFNIEEIEDIKVAIGEVCTNSIQYSTQEKNMIDIEFLINGNTLSITVIDPGKGLCSEISNDNESEIEEKKLRLFIVKSLMDKVDCVETEDGIKLTMIKKIGVGD